MLSKQQTERVLKRYKRLEEPGSFILGLVALGVLIYLGLVVTGSLDFAQVAWSTFLH